MSEKPAISDEPLPDGELVVAVPGTAPAEQPAGHSDLHDHLPLPQLSKPTGAYGHTDAASLAAGISLDLHDPDLKEADKDTLNQPIWSQSGAQETGGAAVTGDAPASSSWSQMPPVLAHLAQVGLTSADQWEEQIQPRLQQLHEEIAQVHAQLDVLERRKPKILTS